MPSLSQHQSTEVVKLLLIGNSGSGKTGALASLANAGFKLRILDYDNGLDVLRSFVKPEFFDNIDFVTLTDKLHQVGNLVVPVGQPTAYVNGVRLLQEWKYTDKRTGEVINLGKVSEWGPDTVLIIDSLTLMGQAIMRFVLQLAGHAGQHPQLQEWGAGMQKQEELAQILYGDDIRCHVIINSHISFIEGDTGAVGYPSALGSKLPPKFGRYFNSVLMAKSIGSGAGARRTIHTQSFGNVELKNPAPTIVPAQLPLATGLADFFSLVTKGTK